MILAEFTIGQKRSGRPALLEMGIFDKIKIPTPRQFEIAEINSKATNKGLPWEREQIRECKESSLSDMELAKKMGRTVAGVSAIRSKIRFQKRIP